MGTSKRKAPPGLQPLEELKRINALSATTDVLACRCTLVTPMYGGGVRAGFVDEAMPIRATAIRGQLRFWWRLLHRKDAQGNLRDCKALFEAERAIWGGLGSGDELTKSKVTVTARVLSTPTVKLQPAATYPQGKSFPQWPVKEEAYALFPAANVNNGRGPKRAAELLQPKACFDLRITRGAGLPDAQWGEVHAAFRWWAAFGGVGARTRRGLGSLAVDCGKDPILPPSAEEIEAAGCRLVIDPAIDNARIAWGQAVEKLRMFRQGVDVGRNPPSGRKDIKSPPGRSRWPEADTIRTMTEQCARQHKPAHAAIGLFPRAMFGLPIITRFKDKDEPAVTSLQPVIGDVQKERMASPLILRAIRTGPEKWAPGALLLPHEHVKSMHLALMQDNHRVESVMSPPTWWNPEKIKDIRPLKESGVDPLSAFMTRFDKKWEEAAPNNASDASPQSVRLVDHYVKFVGLNDAIRIEIKGQTVKEFAGPEANCFKSRMSEETKAKILKGKAKQRGVKFPEIVMTGNRVISFKEEG